MNTSNTLQTPNKSSSHPHSKIIKHPKSLSSKLQKLIQSTITTTLDTQIEHSEGFQNSNANLKHLSQKYEYYYTLTHDGNEFFRIVGIHHIQSIRNNPKSIQDFCCSFLQSSTKADILMEIPEQFKKHCSKEKLIDIYKVLLLSLNKKEVPDGFYKNIANSLNNYKIFDFAIIAIYRLYAYIFGYLNTQSLDDLRLQQKLILTYAKQIDPETVNIICSCFFLRIHIYDISGNNVELTRYGPNILDSQSNISIVVLKCGRHYALVEEKLESKIKEQHQILAHFMNEDLTLSQVMIQKKTQSEQNLTDRKSLWQEEIDTPISPVPADKNRPRRYTQKFVRIDQMSNSFINQLGIKIIPQKQKSQDSDTIKGNQNQIISKKIKKLNIFHVISESIDVKMKAQNGHKKELRTSARDEIQDSIGNPNNKSSSKIGSIRKQTLLNSSMQSSVSIRHQKRQIQQEYYRLTELQKKQIIMGFLKQKKQYDWTKNNCEGFQRAPVWNCSRNPVDVLIQTNGISITVSRK